jgi:signal transduction histidine kinase
MAGQYHPPLERNPTGCPFGWVRLGLPLKVGNERTGLWLLGRRDPDDFYSQAELPTLQALADQTAIALLNQTQAERLSHLYQVDIDRQEAERIQLALELHDGVLNQMAILAMTVDESNEAFESAFTEATAHIREIIAGLRPTMLSYGLRTALDELADEAPTKIGSDCQIRVDLPPSDARYSPQVELHLFRIVQEACQNAMRHAQAREICILGRLDPDCYDLTVADDGQGFASDERLELDSLLAHKHYGLAGMIERANLIGARMEISSIPGMGTRVRVHPTSFQS